MDFLMVVATLCQLNIGAMGITPEKINKIQVQCAKDYITCAREKAAPAKVSDLSEKQTLEIILDCALKREP